MLSLFLFFFSHTEINRWKYFRLQKTTTQCSNRSFVFRDTHTHILRIFERIKIFCHACMVLLFGLSIFFFHVETILRSNQTTPQLVHRYISPSEFPSVLVQCTYYTLPCLYVLRSTRVYYVVRALQGFI